MSKKSTELSKKVLASALSAAMVVAFAPAVAMAEAEGGAEDTGVVAGDTQSLPEPGANGLIEINTSGTYTLTSNITTSIKVTANDVTLNLGNFTVTASTTHAIHNCGKNLLINGGTIDGAAVAGSGAIYTAPGASTVVQSSVLKGSKWYVLKNLGEMTLNQVQLTQNDSGSSAIDNGWYACKAANGNDCNETAPGVNGSLVKLTINGGLYEGGLNTVKNDDLSDLLITGGTFKNYTQDAFQNHGTATVTGGEFIAETLWAIENCGCESPCDPGKLTVTGGDFKGKLHVKGAVSDVTVAGGSFDAGISVEKGSLKIEKGSFTGDIAVDSGATLAITGGTFSADPKACVPAEGYDIHHVGSTYTVHATGEGIAYGSGSAATCTSAGSTGSTYCSFDGYVYSSGSSIPALGHSYTWATTTPATEDAEGVSTGTCSRCGATTTTSIPKLPKSGSDETVVDTSTGAKVDVTVVDNAVTTLPDGSSAAGTVAFNGVSSSADADSAVTEVTVPETVELNGSTYVVNKIQDEAFAGETQLTKVTIPSTVTEIGASAFAGTSITSVDIPEGVTTIGESAFEGTKVETVTLPETVTTVAPSTFKDCASLTTVSAPAAETIGASALSGCTSLTAVEAPAVKEIGASALKDCTSLTTVEAPAAETVAASAFSGCTSLKTVEVPAATTIGAKAFQGCAALKSVDVASAVTIGAKAFSGASRLKTVTTGNKLSSIGAKALKGTKVTVVVLSSKKLTASSVSGSLRGSSVKKVVVDVSGSKKTVSKYVAKYAKAFKKANSGKAVKVVAGR